MTRTVTLTLHDLSLENLALFAVGEMRRLNAAAPVSGEPAVLRPGRWHQLGGADRPAGVLSLAVTGRQGGRDRCRDCLHHGADAGDGDASDRRRAIWAGAGETEQKGQYIVDYDRARIYWLPPDHPLYAAKAGVADDTDVALDYTPDDGARDQVQGALRQVIGGFRYIEDAAEGRGRNIYAPRCSIQPAGGLTLLDGRSSEQQIRLAVSMLEPGGGRPALYIDGQAA